MTDLGAAGASAARNKLARYLRECGVRVQESEPDCPPKDSDFIEAIAVAMRRSDFEDLSGNKQVVFTWGHATFKVPIPSRVVEEIKSQGLLRYDLFEMDSQGGTSHYYLGLGGDGEPSVFRFKRWSHRTEEIETEIL